MSSIKSMPSIRPRLQGRIERRLLVNYRVDPDVVARLLPEGMRPVLQRGFAVAGICLIRLGELRMGPLPAAVGLRSESAAHRIAVEWDTPDGPRSGVYIARRDSASWVNVLVGGRLFPGAHQRATFDVEESADRLRVAYASTDGALSVRTDVSVVERLPTSALFADVDEASRFFQGGSVGFSPGHNPDRLEGLELETDAWSVQPTVVHEARSSYFEDPRRFPAGSAVLDGALVMRGVPVQWRRRPSPLAEAVR